MNNLISIFVISVSLGMDAFSVALAFGMCRPKCLVEAKLRIAVSFGFFQFIMPMIGFWIGSSVAPLVNQYGHWIVFFALSLIGLKMFTESRQNKEECNSADISKGIPLLIASIATSIDALAVGFSFALLHFHIIWSSLMIGIVAFIMSYAGVQLGSKLGNRLFKKPDWIGGIALILLGLKFLLDGLQVL